MRTMKMLSLAVLMSLACFSGAFAQTKKQLKAEIERLREEMFALNQENMVLRQQRDDFAAENENLGSSQNVLQAEISRLERRLVVMEQEYKDLADSYNELKEDGIASAGTPSGPITGPDRSESRTCALLESQLTDNTSYSLDYNRLSPDGWGVQVYSFGSLCQAESKANTFSQKYKLHDTYIRVKRVNGRRVYSVIYGSISDEQKARTYCKNFRKIARDREGRSAFIVQH